MWTNGMEYKKSERERKKGEREREREKREKERSTRPRGTVQIKYSKNVA